MNIPLTVTDAGVNAKDEPLDLIEWDAQTDGAVGCYRLRVDDYVREHLGAELERQKTLDKPSTVAVRDGDQGALIRVLTLEEAHGKYACCCWRDCSDAVPCFRLATPIGHHDYCRDHIDWAIASLDEDWISGWAYREPVPVTGGGDDIPF